MSLKESNKDSQLILREELAIQRTILANYNTLLAFVRTSMYFLVAGLSIGNLLELSYGSYIEIGMYVISIALLIAGFLVYHLHNIQIKKAHGRVGNIQAKYLDDI